MYKVYSIFNLSSISNEMYQQYLRFLPDDRMQKVLRYRNEVDQYNCVMSYLLTMYGIYKMFGVANPDIAATKYGKLYLVDQPGIHFNISHCSKGCVCAISDYAIGVDIQDIHPFSWTVANHCCSSAELRLLEDSANPAVDFTRIWTMKESFLKMKGTGIVDDLCTLDTTKLQDRIKTFAINECYISVASAESFQEEEICLS